ncbi:MAG: MoaD/ThiS family protein [Candidatus Brockarchaeota archaeon]|nr:MoaD/ThiS family protein [Candidatus Brockarchaeota archaeon]
MRIEINYYAWFREKIGGKELLDVEDGLTLEKVVEKLVEKHECLRSESFLVAVNGKLANPCTALKEGDIISLFPPAGGG